MSKHTPGPWTVSKNNRVPMIALDIGDGGEPLPIVSTVHGFNVKQAKANARLIAAAPELLEALRLILEFQDGEHGEPGIIGCQAIEDARAAIAKAEAA